MPKKKPLPPPTPEQLQQQVKEFDSVFGLCDIIGQAEDDFAQGKETRLTLDELREITGRISAQAENGLIRIDEFSLITKDAWDDAAKRFIER